MVSNCYPPIAQVHGKLNLFSFKFEGFIQRDEGILRERVSVDVRAIFRDYREVKAVGARGLLKRIHVRIALIIFNERRLSTRYVIAYQLDFRCPGLRGPVWAATSGRG